MKNELAKAAESGRTLAASEQSALQLEIVTAKKISQKNRGSSFKKRYKGIIKTLGDVCCPVHFHDYLFKNLPTIDQFAATVEVRVENFRSSSCVL